MLDRTLRREIREVYIEDLAIAQHYMQAWKSNTSIRQMWQGSMKRDIGQNVY